MITDAVTIDERGRVLDFVTQKVLYDPNMPRIGDGRADTVIRHKGRDYTVALFRVEKGGETLHSIQITASPTGRNVRIHLDGRELK